MNNRSYKIIWNKERQQYVVKSPSNAKTFARTALAAATVIGIMSSSVGVVSAATAITDTTSGTVSSNGSPVYVETKTTGNKEIEIGETATAEGVNNIAIGNGSQTTGNESVAIGNTALAGGTVTTSVTIIDKNGSKTDPANYTFSTVAAKDATAIGGSTKAQGDQSTAVGYSSAAYGNNSIALGMGAVTGVKDQLGKVLSSSGAIGLYGENAVAIGAKAKAQSTASVAIGANTVAIADTVANFSSSSKRPITVIGTDAIIDGGSKGSSGSTAVGSNSLAGLLYRNNGGTAASFTDADYNTGSGGLTTTKNTAITHPYYTNDLFALAGIDTTKATIDVNEATAIGFDARALGDQSIAIGAQTVAGHSSVAIGGNDMNSVSATAKKAYTDNVGKAFPINSISGFYPTTSALDGSVAIGQKAASYASLGTAIGTAAEVASKATLGTAIGIGAQTGDGTADAVGTTAIGAGAYANARHATAIAIGSQALGVNSVATGYKSNATGVDSVAIGREAKASGTQSISIGTANSVSGNYSGAVGDPSIIAGTGSYTVGNDNAVGATSTNVGAFGNNNQIGATATYDSNGKLQTTPGLVTTAAVDSSKVVGNNNYVNTSGTYVLGSGIGVKSDKSVMDTVANSVYLGDNSQVLATAGANMDVDGVPGSTTTGGATGSVSTATVESTDKATTLTYGGFAGETAVGAVSVGAAGSERRIQNVAAGEISTTSTDAINGSQLYVANQVTANVAGSVADIIGGDTTVNPDGTLAVTNIGNTGKANVSDAIKAAKTTVTSDDNSVTVVSKPDTDGHTNYDLAVTKGSLTAGSNGTVTGAAADGVAGATTSNSFATVGDVANAINNSGFTLTTDKTGSGTNSATDSELINPGDTVTMVAGNNLDVKQVDGTVTYALKDAISLNSVTTGDTTMTTDGIVIKNGAAGKPVSLTKGGLDNGGNTITNVAAGTAPNDAVNFSQLTETVAGAKTTVTSDDNSVTVVSTTDTDGHTNYDLAVTKGSFTTTNGTVKAEPANGADSKPITNSFATVGDVATAINNSGFTLTTDKTGSGTNSATDSELINPGDTVTMVAGNNLDVKQEDGTVTYALKEDITLNSVTTGDTTMTTDGIVIKNGAAGKPVSLTKDGLDNGGNTITNVADGTNDTDAVNVSQLNTKVAGARTTVTSADKTVAIEETVDEDDGHINYDLAVTKGSLTAGSNGTVTGLASPDVDGATPSNSFATVGDVANAINNSGFTLTTDKIGSGTNSAKDSELINPGDTVTMVAGNNLDVKQEDGTVTYALKEDITLSSVTTGDTTMTTDGIVINNGAAGKPVSLTKDGLDNGGNRITNVADGREPNDAVNFSQLTEKVAAAKTTVTSDDNSVTVVPTTVKDGHTNYDLAVTKGSFTTANGTVTAVPANDADSKPITNSFATVGDVATAINNSGFTLKTAKTGTGTNSTTDSELINPGDTVTMVAGNNLDVKQEDGTVTYALKEDITLNSVTTGDTTMTTDGIVINNGAAGKPVSLTKDGLDNGGNTITNVAAGTAPTDAVNVSQLTTAVAGAKTTVTSDNKTVAVRETTKDDGHTNYDLAVTKGSLTAESNGTVTGTASTDVDGATTSNSFATVGDVANAINNSGFTLKTNKTGTGTNSATGSELINPGDNVTMIAGNNLDVAQSNGTVTYALQNDITLNSVTTGNTVMNNAGLTIGSDSNTTVINAGGITINQGAKGNPVSLTNSGLDNGGNKIINVSPGEADTDAVNVSQLKQMGNNVDLAIADVKDDIADTGANAAALSALKPLQYDPLEPTQIMAGIGGYKGSHALAVGVAHFKNESTMFHAGVTMGNHNTMYNAGVTWKFGNRDEEEAVPDRYKAGPISSVYVMQDEVSAIKVQNQRLLAENKAQKDEIEQMKQMIQALVHKVGL